MTKNECRHAYKMLDKAECLWCEDCVEKLVKKIQKKPEVMEGDTRDLAIYLQKHFRHELTGETAVEMAIRLLNKSRLQKPETIFNCPSCGRSWNSSKQNACQCGAIVQKKPKLDIEEKARELFSWSADPRTIKECEDFIRSFVEETKPSLGIVKASNGNPGDVGY